ncbi:hypothetical protein J7T55_014022 [Diaporthe amygdali]|uniref:uncharacterized protein n=1 Tax=Phomopsis amygdali TaxID=1214568 RepID=UPI0022FDF687|nr:uncharacterized protein J7T55_014022 [Diaporthe amygdali]KAJ0119817.1 hypothetical protein J7T55_014022 [Diaporthe amygdali]
MANLDKATESSFLGTMRKVYHPIGFKKGYNFVLWFIFAGALMGFTLARLQYLDFYGIFCSIGDSGGNHAAPGECMYYLRGHEKVGIILHLATILPASFLVVFQFIPAIRYKAMLFHRLNGYLVIILSFIGIAGVFMITRHAFGGTLATQYATGFLSIAFIGALMMAYINIKKLQIEQHRAWMLRAWFYAGCIITIRIVQIIAAQIVSQIGGYYDARPCDQVENILGSQEDSIAAFPDCAPYFNGSDFSKQVAVEADFNGNPVQVAVALGSNFGPAMWLAFAIHAIGVEIYLKLTPAESERLRNVSYQRQLEAGMKNPGRAGLTVDRFGDSEKWVPKGYRSESDANVQATAQKLSDPNVDA